MGRRELKKELEKLDKEMLIKHITELYSKFDNVKEYLDFYVNPNEEVLLKKYEEKVNKAYCLRNYEYDLSIAKKAIVSFKKLGVSPEIYANLLLYNVECAISYIIDFESPRESFYVTTANYFIECLGIFYEEKILAKYKDRIDALMENIKEIRSDYAEMLDQTYFEHYECADEDEELL